MWLRLGDSRLARNGERLCFCLRSCLRSGLARSRRVMDAGAAVPSRSLIALGEKLLSLLNVKLGERKVKHADTIFTVCPRRSSYWTFDAELNRFTTLVTLPPVSPAVTRDQGPGHVTHALPAMTPFFLVMIYKQASQPRHLSTCAIMQVSVSSECAASRHREGAAYSSQVNSSLNCVRRRPLCRPPSSTTQARHSSDPLAFTFLSASLGSSPPLHGITQTNVSLTTV